jgi:Holliday junction resolvasome RuvABC ATP-dependent DNA helicase subunit
MVYPICSDAILCTNNIDRMIKSTQRYATKAIKAVRRAFQVINEETIRTNVEKGLNEPLVDVDKVVMYTARHSVANHLLNSPNVSVRELASILSRSPNTISQYIHSLNKDAEIASVSSSMAI